MRHASLVLRASVAVIFAMSVGACAAASTSPSSAPTAPAASASAAATSSTVIVESPAASTSAAASSSVSILSGPQRPLPPPFGPARNGVIVTDTNGDIVTVDPVTGTKTVIVAGPETDTSPTFSGLGTQILFTRTASDSVSLMIADADGSNVRQLLSGPRARQHLWWDWTADGRRLIYPDYELSGTRTWILDPVTGTTTEVHPGVDQHYAMWRPGHDEYVFRSSESGRLRYFLASADGPAVREITFPDGGVFGAQVSPDGSTLVYVPGDGSPGPLHALDIDTGHDRLLTQPGDGYVWSNPQFSPDGTQILAERHPAPANGTTDVVAGIPGAPAGRWCRPQSRS